MPSNPPYNDDWDEPIVRHESTLRVQDAPEVVREDSEGKLKCLAQCDDTLDCCAPDCPCAAKPDNRDLPPDRCG